MDSIVPPLFCTLMPLWSAFVRVVQVTCATAAMDASASPRKPSVWMLNKSSVRRILLVAWRSNAMRMSSLRMPLPLSVTRK